MCVRAHARVEWLLVNVCSVQWWKNGWPSLCLPKWLLPVTDHSLKYSQKIWTLNCLNLDEQIWKTRQVPKVRVAEIQHLAMEQCPGNRTSCALGTPKTAGQLCWEQPILEASHGDPEPTDGCSSYWREKKSMDTSCQPSSLVPGAEEDQKENHHVSV